MSNIPFTIITAGDLVYVQLQNGLEIAAEKGKPDEVGVSLGAYEARVDSRDLIHALTELVRAVMS